MDKIIQSAAKKYGEKELIHFTLDKPIDNYYYRNQYFFFRQENETGYGNVDRYSKLYEELKSTTIRHLIPNKGSYYDYVVGKHYNTLREWATENKKSLEDICYGVSKLSNDWTYYLPLDEMLRTLNPKWVWPTEQELATEVQNNNKKLVADLRAAIYTVEKQTEYLKNLIAKIE